MERTKTSDFVSGKWDKQYGYQSFSPEPVNRQWVLGDPSLQELVNEAHLRVGELNAFSQLIPDVDFFIRMHVTKEATTSSRIEGTQTNMEEAFMAAEDLDPEKRDDWEEVQNYITAMNEAIGELEKLPVSTRLIRQTHALLLQGVRGQHKLPGAFRSSQNWIGGATLRDAIFIPPHHSKLPDLMGDLEQFLHNEDIHLSDLVRIALAHYQFETIHPFLDGNGRIGRLLITLYLVSRGLLVRPTLYLSAFFEKHKTTYYDNLMRVRTHHDLDQWLRFFMVGVIETAQQSVNTFKEILKLKEEIEGQRLLKLGKKLPKAHALIRELYRKPVMNIREVEKRLQVSAPTANAIVKALQEEGVLTELTGFKRNRIFVFEDYMKLFA
jgi:Fic family protein